MRSERNEAENETQRVFPLERNIQNSQSTQAERRSGLARGCGEGWWGSVEDWHGGLPFGVVKMH